MKNNGFINGSDLLKLAEQAKPKNDFGGWHVCPDGTLDYKHGRYIIEGYRLTKNDWILHMMGKSWVNMNDFIPAYFQAMRNAGIQHATIRFYYG